MLVSDNWALLRKISRCLHYCKCRKSVPIWALPCEVWRICFDWFPTDFCTTAGIGYSSINVCVAFRRLIVTFLDCVYTHQRQPLIWHRGRSFPWRKNPLTRTCSTIHSVKFIRYALSAKALTMCFVKVLALRNHFTLNMVTVSFVGVKSLC